MPTNLSGPDVTAVVLNWARVENVKKIVAHLCGSSLRHTISHVVVWNNSPEALSLQDFSEALASNDMLRIVNSPENLYFQARFLACIDAPTDWCLVQDDDYLVSAEAIRALRKYTRLHDTNHPIHLLPPHEHLSTTLRTRTSGGQIASFAWLGHGTLLRKEHARSFIDLLRSASSNLDDVMKMADNFFSILLNRRAEIWMDPGAHLTGGEDVAFTVGPEGDARNWSYIKIAEEYLEQVRNRDLFPTNGFTLVGNECASEEEFVTRAPLHGGVQDGVWSTNIPMLPLGVLEAGAAARDLHSADTNRRSVLRDAGLHRYVHHAFSNMCDRVLYTAFKSPGGKYCFSCQGCQEGQWLSFDFLEEKTFSTITLGWMVGKEFSESVNRMSYSVRNRDQSWVNAAVVSCEEADDSPNSDNKVSTFHVRLDLGSPTVLTELRAVAGSGSKDTPWEIIALMVFGSVTK